MFKPFRRVKEPKNNGAIKEFVGEHLNKTMGPGNVPARLKKVVGPVKVPKKYKVTR